jgi:predicted HD phosphohydrolase
MGRFSALYSPMPRDSRRRQVAFEAAKLLYMRDETQFHRAKRRAAWRVYGGQFRDRDLPTNREVGEQVRELARADHRLLHPSERANACRAGAVAPPGTDRFLVYAMLLAPLEKIREDIQAHPEGDVLYHSLQVFELAREQLPYDEEFLLAALLHDAGKAIDPREHVAAALEALDGFITPRTAWLIEHHHDALALAEHTLGARSRRRLAASEDFDELRLLARCDRQGRTVGMPVPDVEDALRYIRDLAAMCGE